MYKKINPKSEIRNPKYRYCLKFFEFEFWIWLGFKFLYIEFIISITLVINLSLQSLLLK